MMLDWMPRDVRAACLVLASTLFLGLAGCGAEEEPELSGRFGDGSVGTAVDVDAVETASIRTSSGTAIGSYAYDANYFSDETDEDSEAAVLLVSESDGLVVRGSTISGRPDTPCRFSAAVMARDDDFDIRDAGERSNSQGLDFYQVNLKRGSTYRSVYCATLQGDLGVFLLAEAEGGSLLKSRQLRYVLNSIEDAE